MRDVEIAKVVEYAGEDADITLQLKLALDDLLSKEIFSCKSATELSLPKGVFVVLGGNQEVISPKITHLPVTIVVNKNWKEGMGSSIAAGVKAIQKQYPNTTGIVTVLCDQPFVSANLIYKISHEQ